MSLRLLLIAFLSASMLHADRPPNVVLIITDDQGYGDMSCHGHPLLKTPNIDKLHGESLRLTDFHVDPTCSPTRSALLTGRYSTRTGVWHTINGRSLMRPQELTLAEIFKANGYATGMLGKWHLGSNYPCRPVDQGFDHSILHFDGCIGGGPDYWGNDYYDDHYMTKDGWKPFKGYCTDVWFEEAAKFTEANKDKPFFLYLATNAPHGPYIVPDKYSDPFKKADPEMPDALAKFYGMIANIDENLGKFRKHLEDIGVAENTILIYMTDNGTTAGWICLKPKYDYYNAGMRGWKGSAWEGGQRVPFFMHWPKGGLAKGKDIDGLTAHIDVLPTLVDICELEKPQGPKLDGMSMASLFQSGDPKSFDERPIFSHVQRTYTPPKWDESVTMKGPWRLMNGKELYNLESDPAQQTDIAKDHPKVVEELRADYEAWWETIEPETKQTVHLGLGGAENPTTLYAHDWLMPGTVAAAWHQNSIKRGDLRNGPWAVNVEKAGTYEIKLYRWAPYLDKAMEQKSARLSIGGFDQRIELKPEDTFAAFKVDLPAGPTMLLSELERPNGDASGAYYVMVELVQ
ncbi:MAG: arylsulfatase [Luteolibacter sp.]